MSGPETPDPYDADGEPEQERSDPLTLAREIAAAYRNRVDGAHPTAHRPRRRLPGSTPRRRASREDPTNVADALGDLVRQQGWDDRLAAQRVFTDWAGIVGPEVAQHCQVDGYDDHVVHVRADSTAWATQLRLLAPTIVAKLNTELGDGSVTRIDVRGPQAPSWTRGPRSVKGRGPRDTYG